MKTVTRIILLLVLVVAAFPIIFWAYDVWDDRRHTVSIQSATPVFAGLGNHDCDAGSKIAVLQPVSDFPVKRIRYWKDCATVDIVLSDGREAYVVLGIGGTSISPPLP